MGENTSIEWCDHTFNPWWGCQRVSPGCEHCYAETFDKRVGGDHWGPASTTPRRFFGEKHWNEPLKWDREAERSGVRQRVFCASMADVFEDNDALIDARWDLWTLIQATPSLDWLLLTKRPENIMRLGYPHWRDWGVWDHCWIGTTAENQEYAEKRLPHLLDVPARTRFVSYEPALAPVNFTPYLHGIHWVIAGGESGGKARPVHPKWIRDVRDQCRAAAVPFLFKQWGEYRPAALTEKNIVAFTGDGSEGYRTTLKRVGKKAAGRLLDGRTWDEFPQQPARPGQEGVAG